MLKRASTIDSSSFQKYSVLVSDLRKDSPAAFMSTLILSIRRCTLLYMAMFVVGKQWLQVLLFMSMNVFSLTYLVAVNPFETR